MKKNTTTILLLAAAAAAAYFIFKGKPKLTSTETETAKEEEEKPGEQADQSAEKPDAVVTAPAGQLASAVEKGLQIAQTIKDAAVIVKSGDKTAVLKTGKKKGKSVKRPKLTAEQINKVCKGLKGSKRRACIAKAKKAATIKPTFIPTFNPYMPVAPVFRAEADSTRVVND